MTGASVYLELGPCHRVAALVSGVHAGAVVCLLESALPAWLVLAALPCLLAGFVHALSRHCLRIAPAAVTRVTRRAAGEWHATRCRGQRGWPLSLRAATVLPGLVVLRIECPPGAQAEHVVAFASQVDPDALRRLRRALGRDLCAGC